MLAPKKKFRCPGRSEDDVGAVRSLVELVEGDRLASQHFSQFDRALIGPIAEDNCAGAVAHQMTRRQLRHLARAHHVHGFALKRPKNLFGQLHRHCRYGDTGAANGSFCTNLFGDSEGA